MEAQVNKEFPTSNLLPKKETGAFSFLSKYPEYDGRGVVIAIFDSGIDPSAPGLQVTTENEVKIIDRIDASGAGDIDTNHVVELKQDNTITGLTGRVLKIPENWRNPSSKYHIGVMALYNLYPTRLRERVVKENKEKLWDLQHRELVSKAQKKLQEINENKVKSVSSGNQTDDANVNCSKASVEDEEMVSPDSKSDADEKFSCLGFTEKLQKEDAQATILLLKNLEKKYNNVGPTYDVVLFNDGVCWRACIDSSEKGDLEQGVLLGEYRVTYDYKILSAQDQYSVSINVHNNGNVLEIVGMCASHGTHVSSIAAAHFPDNPDKNGVAPGAKIVSISIGDNRLGSMETGTALVRAMNRVMSSPHYKVDIINMSYGEHAHWSNSGRVGEIAHDVVNKSGMIWIVSAGNHGPGLSTVGVPPDFSTDSIMGVGAYVSPQMMGSEYSLTENLSGNVPVIEAKLDDEWAARFIPETYKDIFIGFWTNIVFIPGRSFTWSSRGPTLDGGRGVSVCAPGSAITSVPKFTLRCNQLMNGTSMACPHTSGCVALILSAMKKQNLAYTPYAVRRAVENTALPLDADVFAEGNGLVRVEKAYEHLLQTHTNAASNVRFQVECGRERGKGIYLRNWSAEKQIDVSVTVEPSVFNDRDPESAAKKLSVDFELMLSCESTWVQHPTCLQISYTSRAFKVTIDPTGLERGRVYFGIIKAYLASNPQNGSVFQIPITVMVPCTQFKNGFEYSIDRSRLKSGEVMRRFVQVPEQTTYAVLNITARGTEKAQKFILHAIQLQPASSVTTFEFYKVLNLVHDESSTYTLGVRGGLTLEVCIARWWSCANVGDVEAKLEFHSLFPSQEHVSMSTCDVINRVDVKSTLRSEEILPQANLKQYSQSFLPAESKIEVLGNDRDTLPEGRVIYQNVLTYNFTVNKSGVEVSPKSSLLSCVLYESCFESQLWLIFDSNKQFVCSGDAYAHKYNFKLDKGSYVLKMHVRHEKIELLERLNDLPINIVFKLPNEIKLDVYYSYNEAVVGGKKAYATWLHKGFIQPVYVAAPNVSDKSLKSLNLSVGDILTGTMSFSKDENARKADNYPLSVHITELSYKKKPIPATTDEKKENKLIGDYEEALKDFKTTWIAKLDMETGSSLYTDVSAAYPEHLPAMLSRLQSVEAAPGNHSEEIISLSKTIVNSIDVEGLLAFYGTKSDSRQDAAKIKTQMDKQRNVLLEALARQGNAIYNSMVSNDEQKNSEDVASLDSIATQILKFVEPNDSKVWQFFVNYYRVKNCLSLACRLLLKIQEEKLSKEIDSQIIELFKQLNMHHISDLMRRTQCTRFPPSYVRF